MMFLRRRLIVPLVCMCLCPLALTSTAQGAPVLPQGARLVPNIEYAHPGGASLLLDLYLPKPTGADPLPVVLDVHGGGWSEGDKSDPEMLYLAGHGYAVASINYRLTDEAIFPAQIYDCKAAVRWLRAHATLYNLDGARIGAWGDSAGGHLVALLGTSADVKELEGTGGNLDQSSRVQAVCDFYGPTDFLQYPAQAWISGTVSRVTALEAFVTVNNLLGGSMFTHREKAIAANPITYITPAAPPFLILHGDQDPLVPLAQSQILLDGLKKKGVEATLVVVKGAGHGFDESAFRPAVLSFFDRHLKLPHHVGAPQAAIGRAVAAPQAMAAPASRPAN